MNQRYHNNTSTLVASLANQAHEETYIEYSNRMKTEHPSDVIFFDMFNQRFAESIIRECMSIIEDSVDHREPASTYVNKIKEHFGVE